MAEIVERRSYYTILFFVGNSQLWAASDSNPDSRELTLEEMDKWVHELDSQGHKYEVYRHTVTREFIGGRTDD